MFVTPPSNPTASRCSSRQTKLGATSMPSTSASGSAIRIRLLYADWIGLVVRGRRRARSRFQCLVVMPTRAMDMAVGEFFLAGGAHVGDFHIEMQAAAGQGMVGVDGDAIAFHSKDGEQLH